MIDFNRCPQPAFGSKLPQHQLDNALCLLLEIVRTQMWLISASDTIRPGSTWIWAATAFLDEQVADNWDLQEDNRESPVDPKVEVFPETRKFRGTPAVNNELRSSRHKLLVKMRSEVYKSQDRGQCIQGAWKALWCFFM